MNWVKHNIDWLKKRNYVLKAASSSNYWFGLSKLKLEFYKNQYQSLFNIILIGTETDQSDFYTIPYLSIQDLLISENLYHFKERDRWVGDIKNHILRFRNTNVERNISQYYSIPLRQEKDAVVSLTPHETIDYSIENFKKEIAVRLKQSKFRALVLHNFGSQCCLTGIMELDLLVASHIIPWSARIETRLDPSNGLCLSVLYDKLFDKGYFSLNSELKVIVTSRLGNMSSETKKWLLDIAEKQIRFPLKYQVSLDALAYHREFIFDKF